MYVVSRSSTVILTTQFTKGYLPLYPLYLESRGIMLYFHAFCEQKESLLTLKSYAFALSGKIYGIKDWKCFRYVFASGSYMVPSLLSQTRTLRPRELRWCAQGSKAGIRTQVSDSESWPLLLFFSSCDDIVWLEFTEVTVFVWSCILLHSVCQIQFNVLPSVRAGCQDLPSSGIGVFVVSA